ncbi:MAG: metallophosphoesterase [Nitrososphaerota archaeon]
MKVAVLSDTHDNLVKLRSALSLARERGVEAVVHLGDFTSPFTLRELSGAAPRVVAVLGNNDGDPLMLHSVASRSGIELAHWPHELELGGRRLLLVHGFGSADTLVRVVEALAGSGRWDAVLYGHTHRVDLRRVGQTLVLNPGEVYGGLTGRSTFAVLDLDRMEAEVVEV